MCECGCNELIPYKIFSIGANVLVVEIYKGCEFCDTGIMVTLHVFSEEEAKELDFIATDNLNPDKFGYTQKNFPILERRDLIDAFTKMVDRGGLFTVDMMEALDDSESGHELLRKAVDIRLDFEKGLDENKDAMI